MSAYILDTNVVSEIGRAEPDLAVANWLTTVDEFSLCTAAIIIGELHYGVVRLPDGARKERLKIWFESINAKFAGRIFPFDENAAHIWGRIKADLELNGQTRPLVDLQIAAIALHHGLPLVTRNTKHFEGLGLTLIDPWTDQS